MRPLIGLLVNPVAGVGGEAGLSGSDGERVQAEALARGGTLRAPERALRALASLKTVTDGEVCFATGGNGLGEDVLASLGVTAEVVYRPHRERTTAEDSVILARRLAARGVSLLLFAGGDGTARDVCSAVGSDQLCLGIPAGVKMHSGVFAVTPEEVGPIAQAVLSDKAADTLSEVVDIDEDARRAGVLQARLYGHLLTPRVVGIQSGKRSAGALGAGDPDGVATVILERAHGDPVLLGPGGTTQAIGRAMGIEPSLLGIDVVRNGKLVASDASARDLHEHTRSGRFVVVVSPIGGQGVVLGRGNQQLDATVLDRLAREDLIVVGTPQKLGQFAGRLLLDAPTRELNAKFSGPTRVVTGRYDEAVLTIG